MARVLVVDDEPDLRELLRVCLRMGGHEVEVASDGRRGLQAVRERRPEVVVLDVMMPAMDGWSVLSALKQDPDPAVALIPIVMLTARSDDLDAIRGSIEGAVRYVTKPFAIQELRQAVAAAVAGAPEPELRRAAQQAALVQLARLESGSAASPEPAAKPRISRLEPVSAAQRQAQPAGGEAPAWPSWLELDRLTRRDQEILRTAVTAASLGEARARLDVSRSYLYARLRRMARMLGFDSGPSLVKGLQAATAARLPPAPSRPGRPRR